MSDIILVFDKVEGVECDSEMKTGTGSSFDRHFGEKNLFGGFFGFFTPLLWAGSRDIRLAGLPRPATSRKRKNVWNASRVLKCSLNFLRVQHNYSSLYSDEENNHILKSYVR